jgi:hypothetical protein
VEISNQAQPSKAQWSKQPRPATSNDVSVESFDYPGVVSISPLAPISDDIVIEHIFGFVGEGNYRYLTGASTRLRRWLYNQFLKRRRHEKDIAIDVSASVPIEWSRETTCKAISASISCAELWVKETYGGFGLTPDAVNRVSFMAAEHGTLEVLKWATRHVGFPFDGRLCEKATEFGQLKTPQWARATGCAWNSPTCYGV